MSADHQDAPGSLAAPQADINDVFTWMDGSKAVLAMTVYPNAPMAGQFDNTVQYVFHTTGTSMFAGTLPVTDAGVLSNSVDVIATFDSASPQQNIHLWVGSSEYVTGNANVAAGLSSKDGKVKVFAGLRHDPFFFNLDGFHNAVAIVEGVAATAGTDGGVIFNQFGCPSLNTQQSGLLVDTLGLGNNAAPATNHFAAFNALAIVVSLDPSLLTASGTNVGVWGATYSTVSSGDAGGQ